MRLIAAQVQAQNHRESERGRHAPAVRTVDQLSPGRPGMAEHNNGRKRGPIADGTQKIADRLLVELSAIRAGHFPKWNQDRIRSTYNLPRAPRHDESHIRRARNPARC
jgi:hypothetical protein